MPLLKKPIPSISIKCLGACPMLHACQRKTGPQGHILWSHWHVGPLCFSPFVGRLLKLSSVCGLSFYFSLFFSFLFFFFSAWFFLKWFSREDAPIHLKMATPSILLTSKATEKWPRTEKHGIKIFPQASGAHHGVESINNLAFKQDEYFSLIHCNICKRKH